MGIRQGLAPEAQRLLASRRLWAFARASRRRRSGCWPRAGYGHSRGPRAGYGHSPGPRAGGAAVVSPAPAMGIRQGLAPEAQRLLAPRRLWAFARASRRRRSGCWPRAGYGHSPGPRAGGAAVVSLAPAMGIRQRLAPEAQRLLAPRFSVGNETTFTRTVP
jgi:hypothetical protein